MVSRAYLQQLVVATVVVKMESQKAQFLKNLPELASILFLGCWDMSWLLHIQNDPGTPWDSWGNIGQKLGKKVIFFIVKNVKIGVAKCSVSQRLA